MWQVLSGLLLNMGLWNKNTVITLGIYIKPSISPLVFRV